MQSAAVKIDPCAMSKARSISQSVTIHRPSKLSLMLTSGVNEPITASRSPALKAAICASATARASCCASRDEVVDGEIVLEVVAIGVVVVGVAWVVVEAGALVVTASSSDVLHAATAHKSPVSTFGSP